jgi:hypothetical protein
MVNVKVDTKAFDKALDEYMQFTKRSVAEVINAKCWFIARNAILMTEKTPVSRIDSELSAPSREYAPAPLAAIIINSRQKKKGEKGLTGRKMANAVRKMIAARHRAVNFLRSGWLPAVRILEQAVKRGDINFSKRYAPKKDSTVKQYGTDKGTAIWAKPNYERVYGQIENAVQGGRLANKTARVHTILTTGLQKAINAEIASMRTYVERKMNPEINKFNR